MLTLVVLIFALLVVVPGIYYLIFKKEKMRQWGFPMKLLFYGGFSVGSLIVLWEIIAISIKYLS